ncbi:hypothetical protein JAAARDRAFT_31231 [Jaapia argillacea MUCL 33604]|uniref:Uncharacterized protein n=1 Tax=Jaapia argillacea MUCL 33604 TaxID=933084 RepID=A0A067QE16_9AGAM|nr:hypothetical protein JAAARDRAFT_31231 [Jaapia argillacea MUCL 33604]
MSLSTPPPAEHSCLRLPATPQRNSQATDESLAHGAASATNSETERNPKISKYCLLGRGTRIIGVQRVPADGETLGDNDVVGKVSWPGGSRQNEGKRIDPAT